MRNFSPLATGNVLPLGFYISGGKKYRRYMARQEQIAGMTFHHIVGPLAALQRELLNTSRTLSVQYGIAGDGKIHGCVAEHLKANTTSDYSDHSHVTAELSNESLAPEYRISDATFDAAARLAADVAHEYGFVPSASTIRFHRQFVPTECPGPWLWDRRDEFIALTRRYYYAGSTPARPAPPKPSAKSPEQIEEEEIMAAKDDIIRALKADIGQSMEVIRRESRPRLYERKSTGELILVRLEVGFLRGPWRDEKTMRADLPVNGEHLVSAQEYKRRLKVSDADWALLTD